MSAEFISEYNEDTISAAVEYMEGNMRGFNYIGEYIEDVQELYSKYPDGEVELMRMVRAARLITGRKAGDCSENVQAVYHGELLGLELINNLDPHVGKFFKTGYAQSFIQNSLEKEWPEDPRAVENNAQVRLRSLSRSLQADLSSPMYAHDLNPIYEEFGLKATSKLSDETDYQDLAMIGFRMIVTEALKPSLNSHASELLQEYPAFIKEQKAHNFMNWEDISTIRNTLYSKFIELSSLEEDPDISDESTLAETDRYIERRLLEFTKHHNLLNANDLLSVRGEFFSVVSDEKYFSFYDRHVEIQGDFDSIRIIDVPSNKQLLKNIDEGIKDDEAVDVLVCTLALRIANPVFIDETTDGEQMIESAEGETIDIPLNYDNVTFKRIKAEELELEA